MDLTPAAIQELRAMPTDAWERVTAWSFLVDFGLVPREGGRPRRTA